jgi:hypothetical protein
VASAASDVERAVVDFLRAHGPVHRDPKLRSRGTADILTMVGSAYEGRLSDFRRHLRRARKKGLIHGDLFELLAAGPEADTPAPPRWAVPDADVIDLTEPNQAGPSGVPLQPGHALFPPAGPLVRAITQFDRSDEGLRLLAERGLSFGMLLDFSIEIDRERPFPKADPVPGPATRQAVGALWIRGFEPADIAEVLDVSTPLAASLCEPLSRLHKVREIVPLDLAGMPAAEISRAVGLSPATVKRTLRRIGFAVHPDRPSATVALIVDDTDDRGIVSSE